MPSGYECTNRLGTQRYCQDRSGSMLEALNTDQLSNEVLKQFNGALSETMCGDVVFINSLIVPPLDDEFRVAVEELKQESAENHLIVVLETNGGLMETVERLVAVMRTGVAQDSWLWSISWPIVLEHVPGGSSHSGMTRILGYTPCGRTISVFLLSYQTLPFRQVLFLRFQATGFLWTIILFWVQLTRNIGTQMVATFQVTATWRNTESSLRR